jgi:hypothetical protein
LHHVEALVVAERNPPLDPFTAFALRALALSPSASPAELDGRLHLGQQVLGRVLGDLASAGLAESDAAGLWCVTDAGRSFAAGGETRRTGFERRAFHFRDAPPGEFLSLEGSAASAVGPPPGWSFDPAAIQRCIERSADWKRDRRFPPDVCGLLTPDVPERPGEPPAWRRVVFDRAEHMVLALAVVPNAEGEELRGFAVEPRGWLIAAARPVLSMGVSWADAFPEVARGPAQEAWRGAWRTWCQNHGVPTAEAEACALNREGALLRVEASGELRGRLRSANGEASRDEVWLLAGEGGMRAAARVEFAV